MSDSKWVRLLKALTAIGDQIRSCKVKLVWDHELRDLSLNSNLSYGFDFYDHAMEAMISGKPKGWYDSKEIEWIEFPVEGQDIELISGCIQNVGKFEIERSSIGLRLLGYR